MKKMMGLLVVMMLLATGCGNKSDKLGINKGRTARTEPQAVEQLTTPGMVYGDYQDEFQQGVIEFLDAVVPQEAVGFVNGGEEQVSDHDTGVWFGGRVTLQSGRFTPNTSMARVNVATTSRLLIMIWDQFAGTNDATGKEIPPFPAFLKTASGYVEGNRAVLTFSDDYGSVTLDGNFDNQYFEGEMTFVNKVSYTAGATATRGRLGRFVIATCSFFTCN